MSHLVDQAIIEAGLVCLEEGVVEAVPHVVDLRDCLGHFNLIMIISAFTTPYKLRELIPTFD